jgi:hypothetical protein
MPIMSEQANVAKRSPANGSKVAASQINNNKDLMLRLRRTILCFFGSFFSSATKNGKKHGPNMPAMEAPQAVIKP